MNKKQAIENILKTTKPVMPPKKLNVDRSKLTIVSYAGVKRHTKKILHEAIWALNRISKAPLYSQIELVPSPVVQCKESGESGFGVFFITYDPLRDIEIQSPTVLIGAKWVKKMGQQGLTEKDWLHLAVETVCHEWVHFEQYRDCKPINEVGVKRRAAFLLRKVLPQIEHLLDLPI